MPLPSSAMKDILWDSGTHIEWSSPPTPPTKGLDLPSLVTGPRVSQSSRWTPTGPRSAYGFSRSDASYRGSWPRYERSTNLTVSSVLGRPGPQLAPHGLTSSSGQMEVRGSMFKFLGTSVHSLTLQWIQEFYSIPGNLRPNCSCFDAELDLYRTAREITRAYKSYTMRKLNCWFHGQRFNKLDQPGISGWLRCLVGT